MKLNDDFTIFINTNEKLKIVFLKSSLIFPLLYTVYNLLYVFALIRFRLEELYRHF